MMVSKPHYTQFNIIVQRISATRLVSGFFAHHLHRIDKICLKLSKGRMTLTHSLSGLPVIILTTIGARSGLPRTMPLACIPDSEEPGCCAVIASNLGQHYHPGWYYNLKTHSRVTGTFNQQARIYIAHEADGEEYDKFWRDALEIYPGFRQYQQRLGNRRIPIMVLVEEKPHFS